MHVLNKIWKRRVTDVLRATLLRSRLCIAVFCLFLWVVEKTMETQLLKDVDERLFQLEKVTSRFP